MCSDRAAVHIIMLIKIKVSSTQHTSNSLNLSDKGKEPFPQRHHHIQRNNLSAYAEGHSIKEIEKYLRSSSGYFKYNKALSTLKHTQRKW